ncbi:MAG TPA: hypothetical protein VMR96_08640, partial [Solirubrobacterales bacterium]|nr:hypothetical protein [Solirubrobacterales bacterium]
MIFVASQSAYALGDIEVPASPSDAGASLSEEIEFEDECVESGEEEGEDSEEADEECEVEAEDAGFSPADDCYLRTAQARVVAYPTRNMMRLTLGYTTYTPARATVEYGAKSDPHLGTVRRQLGRSGVVRLSKQLGSKEMAQLQASRRFTVTVHVPEAPRECQRFEVQR